MEEIMVSKVDMSWQIALETAIVSGKMRLAEMEKAEVEVKKTRQDEIRQAWGAYNDMLLMALPEVLRPMTNLPADWDDLPVMASRDYVLIDCEPWGMAPIAVALNRVLRSDDGSYMYMVVSYTIYGICIMRNAQGERQAMFETGDELFEIEPMIETDFELALARAHQHYAKMLDVKFKLALRDANEEPEYLPADLIDECFPGGPLAIKCLEASIRSIVRDEMYKPPSAA
jgi:hypothetical protein